MAVTWRIIGPSQTVENGGAPAYTVSYAGEPPAAPVSIQLDPIFPGNIGAANPEGSGGVNPADYAGTFAAAVNAAIGLLPVGSGISFDAATYMLTFQPGVPTSFAFALPLVADALPEGSESFLIRIQNPSTGTIDRGFDGVLTTIADDDAAAPDALVWAIAGDYAAVEGAAASFIVALRGNALAPGATASVELFPQFPAGLNLASTGDFAQGFAASVQAAALALPPGSGVSFDAGTGRLTFTGGGVSTFEFALPTRIDGAFEGDEIYLVDIRNPSAGTAVSASAASVFSIVVDRDAQSAGLEWLIAGTQVVVEGGVASYTVKWKGPDLSPGQAAAIDLGVSLPGGPYGAAAADFKSAFAADIAAAVAALPAGTAIAYDAATQRLTFGAGAPREFAFALATAVDTAAEAAESFAVTLSNPSAGRIIETLGGIDTRILDGLPPPQIAIADAQAGEGQPLVFDVTLTGPSATPVVLDLVAAGVTATAGADFAAAAFDVSADGGATWSPAGGADGRQITFGIGATALKVRVAGIADSVAEGPETLTLAVGTVIAGNVAAATDAGTGTIADDDGAPQVTIGDASALEGEQLVFDVALSNPSAAPLTLALAATGTTAAAGEDFSAAGFDVSADGGATWQPAGGLDGREITFAAGATALQVRVATSTDAVAEGSEALTLSVAAVVEGAAGTISDTGTGIIIDGTPAPRVAIGDAAAPEGQPLIFDVTLSKPAAAPVTLDLAVTGMSATAGQDFAAALSVSADGGANWVPAGGAAGSEITFGPGTTALKVRVDTAADTLAEGDETLALGVKSVLAGTVADSADTGTGTIADVAAAGVCRLLVNEVGIDAGTAPSGAACQSYVEIVNAGTAACTAEDLSCYRIEVAGPCGEPARVRFASFDTAFALPPGAFLVLYENGEFRATAADGTPLATGTFASRHGDWNLGDGVTDPIAVNLYAKGEGSIDAFIANGADRDGLHGDPAFGNVAAESCRPHGWHDNAFAGDDFRGALAHQATILDVLGRDRPLHHGFAAAPDGPAVFARVPGSGADAPPDSDSAADWRVVSDATEGARNPDAAAEANRYVPGSHGDDVLHGGTGTDLLLGRGGADIVIADAGDDVIVARGAWHGCGMPGGDVLVGDAFVPPGATPPPPGKDAIFAGAGDDLVFGDSVVVDAALMAALDTGDPALLRALFTATLIDPADPAFDPALRAQYDVAGAADWIQAGRGDDIVFGQGGDDRLMGGWGNDLLIGGAGADLLRGGRGADTLVADPREDAIFGGRGKDTLLLAAGGVLDLDGIAGQTLHGIERIDLRGGDGLDLHLDVADLLGTSGDTSTLAILGDAGDRVTFDVSGHSVESHLRGDVMVHVIDGGDAVLRVDAAMQQNVIGL